MPVYTCPKGHEVVELIAHGKAPKTFYCSYCKRSYPVESGPNRLES